VWRRVAARLCLILSVLSQLRFCLILRSVVGVLCCRCVVLWVCCVVGVLCCGCVVLWVCCVVVCCVVLWCVLCVCSALAAAEHESPAKKRAGCREWAVRRKLAL
jgi:hypothetical protein